MQAKRKRSALLAPLLLLGTACSGGNTADLNEVPGRYEATEPQAVATGEITGLPITLQPVDEDAAVVQVE